MAKINTREKLVSYIRRRCGEPIVVVELDDEQIDDIIDEVILKFSEFAFDGQDIRCLVIPIFEGVREYKLDSRVSSVMSLKMYNLNNSLGYYDFFQVPQGYKLQQTNLQSRFLLEDYEVAMSRLSKLEYITSVTPNYSFNSNNKLLTFHQDLGNNTTVALEVALEYEPEDIDLIYNHPWIKDMCVAQAKIQWGTNVGKYSGTLINGNTINYSDIKADGQADAERLNDELLRRWSPPLGIVVG